MYKRQSSFFQNLSRRFLKVFTVFAETTESGRLFQAEIILFVKENLRVSNCIGDWYKLYIHDTRREIKNLFVRTNILISRFYKCSSNVKLTFFKVFVWQYMMWLSGKSFQLLFSISSDLVITGASRSCLDFRDVIVCLVFLWIYVCQLWTLLYTIHVFCLHNYALNPVIRLYCGLILLEYASF